MAATPDDAGGPGRRDTPGRAPSGEAFVSDGVRIDEPPAPRFVRSWSDAVQCGVAAVLVVLALLAGRYAGELIVAFEREVLRAVEQVAAPVEPFVVAVIQAMAAYAPIVVVAVMLAFRCFRRLGLVIVAGAAASLLMRAAVALVPMPRAEADPSAVGPGFFTGGAVFPSPAYLAFATAIVTVEMPWTGRSWRRIGPVILVALGVGRLMAGTSRDAPPDLFAGYALGWFVGTAVLLAAGRPNRHPGGRDVVEALRRAGIEAAEVTSLGSRRTGIELFRVVPRAGRALFVKIRRGDDRAAGGAASAWRHMRLRQPVGEHPFWSPMHTAEHEALVASAAHRCGVPAPDVITVTSVGLDRDCALLAVEAIDAEPLRSVPADAWSAELLTEVWRAVVALRAARIAHRSLRADNLVRIPGGQVMITGFELGVLAAEPELFTNDLVEILCSTAVRVGPERAVAAAVEAVGPDAVEEILPRLQPLVLTARTRSEVRAEEGLLDQLSTCIQAVRGTAEVPLEHLERISAQRVMVVAMGAVALYLFLPEVAKTSQYLPRLEGMRPWWALGALAASALTYVGAAVSLSGAVPRRVATLPLVKAQVACQFANFAGPAQLGGMALNIRFLQKRGVDGPVAVAAVGLNAVTGTVTHLALLGVVVYWSGTDDLRGFRLPGRTIGTILALAGLIAGVTLLVPMGRRLARQRVLPLAGRAVAGLREVSRSPTKLTRMLGGALFLSCAYIAALACAVAAFGGGLSLASVALVFLGASVVAATAPTPGGLVAVEGALLAGLASVGLDPDQAFLSMLWFRVATFWLPLLPGWWTFTRLQRSGAL